MTSMDLTLVEIFGSVTPTTLYTLMTLRALRSTSSRLGGPMWAALRFGKKRERERENIRAYYFYTIIFLITGFSFCGF